MSRRTKKRDDGWYDINLEIDESVDKELRPLVTGEYVRRSLNKLGQLEDIEEELGIDLVTLKNLEKVWFKWNEKDMLRVYVFSVDIKRGLVYAKRNGRSYTMSTKDYGKTWALTKEELL